MTPARPAGGAKPSSKSEKATGEFPQSPLTVMRADGTEDVFEGFDSKWTWNIRVDGCLEVVRSWWNKPKKGGGDSLRVREVARIYNRDAWLQARGGDIRHFPVEATRASDL